MRSDPPLATLALLALLATLAACSVDQPPTAQPEANAAAPAATATRTIMLPGGEGGIGLDDLRYSRALQKVIVPAGRTGSLDLIDPATGAVEAIHGFSETGGGGSGHGEGTTSADEGAGLLFAIDRTRLTVDVIDPATRTIVGSAPLAGGPDYVRFVPSTRELWVTEPDAEQIEIFSLPPGLRPTPKRSGTVAVAGGPESLVIDGKRGRAYSHLWKGSTVAIDLAQRSIAATWSNGCTGSRGIALDEEQGWLFVGCREGSATVLDVEHDGKLLSRATTGVGVDIIDYDPVRRHLYVPAAESATLSILGVSAQGQLSVLGTSPAAQGSHCVTSDGDGQVFVGDPHAGRLLVIRDDFPPSG